MSNTRTVVFLLLVSYVLPLSLMFVRGIWIKIYFAIALAAVVLLGYEAHTALQTEDDCGAGCALVISALLLIIAAVMGGFLLAALSAFCFKKCRALMANRSFRLAEAQRLRSPDSPGARPPTSLHR
jgi:hypothetical protein